MPGWYIHASSQGKTISVDGPYSKRQADALAKERQTYFVRHSVRFHWRKPSGTEPPTSWKRFRS